MKKYFIPALLLVLASGMIACSSSSSSLESDVKKMASYQCEMKQLLAADPSDVSKQKRLADLQKEMEDFVVELEKKYEEKKGDTAWERKGDMLMKAEMEKCK